MQGFKPSVRDGWGTSVLRELFLPSHAADLQRLEEAVHVCGGLHGFMTALERAGLLKTEAPPWSMVLDSAAFPLVASFTPDVFGMPGVSKAWCERLGRNDVWIAAFSVDVKPRSMGSVRTVASRIPPSLLRLSLDFSSCGIGKDGVRAVAEKLPAGLSTLSLDLSGCGIGEGGARAVEEKLPARLTHRSIHF